MKMKKCHCRISCAFEGSALKWFVLVTASREPATPGKEKEEERKEIMNKN